MRSLFSISIRVAALLLGMLFFHAPGWSNGSETAEWPVYVSPWETIGGGALDVSFLLDAPAGKHGFLGSQDGVFRFQDGTRARFWGVNLAAASNFPNATQARILAERLAHAGCNMVRLHHMDAPWHSRPIIDYSHRGALRLDPEQLDRLDRLVFELKKRGIYIHLDLLTHRRFEPGEELPEDEKLSDGQKHASLVNRHLIEQQKEYARALLTHLNPHTQLRYADDPVFAVVQICNENSVFWRTKAHIPEFYLEEIDALWNAWLVEEYGTREALNAAWTSAEGKRNLHSGENPHRGTVERPPIGFMSERYFDPETPYSEVEGGAPRVADHFRFLAQLQDAFYTEMTDYLRELGVKCVVAGSNLPNGIIGLRREAAQGITETDAYFGHPRDGFGVPNRFPDASMSSRELHAEAETWGITHLPQIFSQSRTAEAPLLVTEWNQPYPMPYRAESIPFVAAYGAYQDIDGFCLFSYNHRDWDRPLPRKVQGFFNSGNDPAHWGLFVAGALMFHRRDIRRGETVVDVVYGKNDLLTPHPRWRERFNGLTYLTRVRQTYADDVYTGGADLAIAGGFRPGLDLTQARHALLFSRSPHANPYRMDGGLLPWIQKHLPGSDTPCETSGTARGEEACIRRTPILVDGPRCVVQNVAELEREDPAWEARLTIDLLQMWGLREGGRERLDREGWVTDTEELTFNDKRGILKIDTPRTQGIVGRAAGETVHLSALTVTPSTPFAVILCQSLDGQPLEASRHLLLTAVGRVENTGQQWLSGTRFADDGEAPVRIEPICAEFALKTKSPKGWRGYGLAADGSRAGELPLSERSGRVCGTLRGSVTGAQGGCRVAERETGSDKRPIGQIHFELVLDTAALEL